jgi:uracil-DNA glycosylase
VPAAGGARRTPPGPTRWLLVGLAPGRLGADRTGRPFLGDRSGDRLRSLLAAVGLSDAVALTNAVKCAPQVCRATPAGCPRAESCGRDRGCRPANRDPTRAELARCQPYLAAEIALVEPAGVIALGRLAEEAVRAALGRPGPRLAPGVPTGAAPWVAYLPHPASWGYHPVGATISQDFLSRLAAT